MSRLSGSLPTFSRLLAKSSICPTAGKHPTHLTRPTANHFPPSLPPSHFLLPPSLPPRSLIPFLLLPPYWPIYHRYKPLVVELVKNCKTAPLNRLMEMLAGVVAMTTLLYSLKMHVPELDYLGDVCVAVRAFMHCMPQPPGPAHSFSAHMRNMTSYLSGRYVFSAGVTVFGCVLSPKMIGTSASP